MGIEVLNAAAGVGTFVVITASAIAAVIQLRHLRASNHLQAFMTITHEFETPEFQARLAFVRNELPQKIADPQFRAEYYHERGADRAKHPEFAVSGFFEEVGMFVKRGLVDKAVFLDAYSPIIRRQWELLLPFIAISRARLGKSAWENFEYLAVLAYEWIERHPDGTLPKNFPRLPVPDAETPP